MKSSIGNEVLGKGSELMNPGIQSQWQFSVGEPQKSLAPSEDAFTAVKIVPVHESLLCICHFAYNYLI